ncbi:hypothetical protein LCER1_G008495 [Lachnellula cervina]|uniref:Uncharacterized protein n=1 Tax=Lachnellula cervina TaxID=1316786 RepID=A0A7D8YR30_9HELO|nr:hypothetical protein LCER1_G008495 [Lachnellula cervina]
MSSDASSTSSSSSSASSSYYNDASQRHSMDASAPRVETLRCSRCAMCVETVATARGGNGELGRVSTDDASASGMVRFGHNLYYCDRQTSSKDAELYHYDEIYGKKTERWQWVGKLELQNSHDDDEETSLRRHSETPTPTSSDRHNSIHLGISTLTPAWFIILDTIRYPKCLFPPTQIAISTTPPLFNMDIHMLLAPRSEYASHTSPSPLTGRHTTTTPLYWWASTSPPVLVLQ